MIVTITYKLVLVVIGVTLTIFGQGFIKAHLYRVRHIFYLGTALNVFCVSGMLVLVFHPMLARSILVKGLDLLEKMQDVYKRQLLDMSVRKNLSGSMRHRLVQRLLRRCIGHG